MSTPARPFPGNPAASPMPSSPAPTQPPTTGPPPGRRSWLFVGVAAAAIVNILLWGTAALVGLGLMLANLGTTTVYADDFGSNSGEFAVFDDANGTGRYHDGAYWLTLKTPGLHYVGVTFDPRDVVDVTATLSLPASARTTDIVALRVGSDSSGYVFAVTANGRVSILSFTGGKPKAVLAFADVSAPKWPAILRVVAEDNGSRTKVVGYLDGREVLSVADTKTWNGLSGAGVAVGGDTAPVTARVDEVAVRTGFSW